MTISMGGRPLRITPSIRNWETNARAQLVQSETLQGTTWNDVERRVSTPVRTAIEKVLTSQDGSVLSREECLLLAHAEGDDLFGMVVAANQLRQRLVGDVTVTSSPAISISRMCALWAASFAPSASAPRRNRLLPVAGRGGAKCRQAKSWGATEVCIQGGLPRNLPPFYYRDILRAVKSATPKMHAMRFRRWRWCTALSSPACRSASTC